MFKDFHLSPAHKSVKWEIVITDDDFEEYVYEDTVPKAIIKIYQRRNLNVSKNLFLFFKSLTLGHTDLIKNMIANLIIEIPSTIKYKEELEKYLILL